MIQFTEQDSTRTFYVIFDRFRGRKMFWNYLTKDGFDHIYLLTPIGDQTLAITPTCNECLFDIWPCTAEEAISWLPDDTTAILRYESKYKCLKSWKFRAIISCVSWAKYVLGIDSFAVTPKQLYKKLIKLGIENGKPKRTSTSTSTATSSAKASNGTLYN